MPAIRSGLSAPLHALHGAQVAVRLAYFVPVADPARLEPVVIAAAPVRNHRSSWMMDLR